MASRDYFDIDDILAVHQRVPCYLKNDVVGLTYNYDLIPSINKKGSKLSLPFWIADTLDAEEFVDLDVPPAFSKKVQRRLLASSTNVNLAAICPYYYKLGQRLSELSPGLVDFLSHVYLQRLVLISEQSQYENSTSSAEFLTQLESHEKSLFLDCLKSRKDYNRWQRGEEKTIQTSFVMKNRTFPK
ncbi:hypothetical protein BB559_002287 [Furculomyces boomerangus]|uniref:DNA replication complex GINS protein PSF3 n=2 Tax=Harpellales TaxID=61421 RepID=A0A2T9YWG2_9FUNG|nr:hypothetical protein BB559_002287 [Furculomyces boomerangus]PWA02868.1 hypothetical protein BB558_000959 [Smittium angustum]